MKFLELSQLFEQLESTTGRNDMTALLAEFISAHRSSSAEELAMAAYLFTGRVAPGFVPAEYNLSEKSLISVLHGLSSLYTVGLDIVKLRADMGDIGLVAEVLVGKIESKSGGQLEVMELYDRLWAIVSASGTGSSSAKMAICTEVMLKLSPVEAKFFARIVSGKMRLGVSTKTLLDALSVTLNGDKGMRTELDSIYGVDPDIGWVIQSVLSGDLGKSAQVVVGVPLHSRLVERVKDFDEALERLDSELIVQPKFDGLRCQAHVGVKYSGSEVSERVWSHYMIEMGKSRVHGGTLFDVDKEVGEVELFSRNLEGMTDMFPEVAEELLKFVPEGTVLDGEVIGWDFSTESFLPFQETMTRKRKHGVSEAAQGVPVKYFIFDIIAYKGESLLDLDTIDRLEKLDQLFKTIPADSLLSRAETRSISSKESLEKFFIECVEGGLEGLIVKSRKGGYKPGVRDFEWIKLKKSMDKKLVDSVDVVVMGYYYGSGKKTQFGMGALLGGVYNSESREIESITKIGTGITDAQWREISDRLKGLAVKDMPSNYKVSKALEPDVWVLPDVVCTVEADEITKSKVHMAAMGKDGLGLALRFPRLIEFDRDKSVEQATSVEELEVLARV